MCTYGNKFIVNGFIASSTTAVVQVMQNFHYFPTAGQLTEFSYLLSDLFLSNLALAYILVGSSWLSFHCLVFSSIVSAV